MTTSLEIVLDRFVRLDRASGIDLASGERVHLRRVSAGSNAECAKRAETAARVSALRIAGVMPLIDYGVDGGGAWIEAYRGAPEDGDGAAFLDDHSRSLGALLRAAGCVLVARHAARLRQRRRSSWFVPVPLECVRLAAAGRGEISLRARDDDGPPSVGTAIERREEIDAVLEWLLDGDAAPGARLLRVDAPPGAGCRTFFEGFAREARLAGFVPVSSALCADGRDPAQGLTSAALSSLLRERHVVVLEPRVAAPPHDVARFLARLNTAAGRPLALVVAGHVTTSGPAVSLGPMRPDQLRRSVLGAGVEPPRLERAIQDSIQRSGGWPGAFAEGVRASLGLAAPVSPYPFSAGTPACVREALPELPRPSRPASQDRCASALERAWQLAARGRHATAERLLRRTIGYLQRRRRAADEARARLALGRLLLERERRREACEALESSRRLFDEARDGAGVVLALVHLGCAHLEDAALAEAESVLRTAEVAARHAGLGELRRAACVLLARCLFWQDRHDAAWAEVEAAGAAWIGAAGDAMAVAESAAAHAREPAWRRMDAADALPAGLSAVAADIGVRTALARHDAGLAARRLAAAGEIRAEDGSLHAGTLVALRILVQGALGELGGATATASAGLALMRRLHAPLAAREIRLAQIEACIEARASAPAAACLKKVSGRPGSSLTGLARLRLEKLAERLAALERVPPGGAEDGRGTTVDAAAVVSMLQQCHDAASETDAAAGVCRTVRNALGAAAVTAFARVGGEAQLAAAAGQRASRPDRAERAMDALVAIGPEDSAAGVELAAPVRSGGAAVGAIVVRWTQAPSGGAGGPRVRGVIMAAAAAIAPALAALAASPPGDEAEPFGPGEVAGHSAAMADVRRQVVRAAAAPYPVLILGESGTGKELIAKAIHAGSARRARRFCAVNCAALSDDLFEAELFGHARGAFTGAAADRQGLFEEADGGTLFLDEVGELSPRAQAKLLRAIQEGEIRRIGENHARRVDTRIVAATNRPLGDEARAGQFRRDLLYRLDVVRITVPPLRERPEDIAPLARAFWREAARRTGSRAELSPAALAALARYDWPGNVRELQNTMAALAVQAPASGRVGPGRLPEAIRGQGSAHAGDVVTLAEARRRFETAYVRATLARAGGQRAAAASALGVSRQGFAKLMTRLGIADAVGG